MSNKLFKKFAPDGQHPKVYLDTFNEFCPTEEKHRWLTKAQEWLKAERRRLDFLAERNRHEQANIVLLIAVSFWLEYRRGITAEEEVLDICDCWGV